MTAVDDLIAFVRAQLDARMAQLDEDERVALAALHLDAVKPGAWITEHHNSATHAEPNRCHIAEDKGGHYWSVAHEVFIPNAEHIARWDPARALEEVRIGRAEVEVKRRILDAVDGRWAGPEVVRLLAQPYAGRPGWCEDWQL
jgi:hypothetical protein